MLQQRIGSLTVQRHILVFTWRRAFFLSGQPFGLDTQRVDVPRSARKVTPNNNARVPTMKVTDWMCDKRRERQPTAASGYVIRRYQSTLLQ